MDDAGPNLRPFAFGDASDDSDGGTPLQPLGDFVRTPGARQARAGFDFVAPRDRSPPPTWVIPPTLPPGRRRRRRAPDASGDDQPPTWIIPMAMPDEGQRRRDDASGGRRRRRDDAAPDEPAPDDAPPARPRGADATPTPCLSAEMERVLTVLGPPEGAGPCFACRKAPSGTLEAPVAREGMAKIRGLIRSAPAGTSRVELAREIAELYEAEIRRVANLFRRPDEEECPPWSAASIYYHFFTPEHERLDAVTSIESRARAFEELFHALYHNGTYEQMALPDGRLVRMPRETALKQLTQLDATLTRLYALQPANMRLAASDAPDITRVAGIAGSQRQLFGRMPGDRL